MICGEYTEFVISNLKKYFFYLIVFVENRHSSCPLQEGEWPDQGERQTPGDGGASHPPVQGELA